MIQRALLTTLLLLPSLAFASSAGFPERSVWLSDDSPALGEKIRIYAVVYNGTESALSGTVTFFVDSEDNGSKAVSLESGESVVVASAWTATHGEHSFTAQFAAGDTIIQTSEAVIAKVEVPPSKTERAVEQVKDISSQVAAVGVPIVTTVAHTVFNTTEGIREAGVRYLEGVSNVARNNTDNGRATSSAETVLGTSTKASAEKPAAEGSIMGAVSAFKDTLTRGALTIFQSLWLFYPILVVLLLVIFRLLHRWATRPRF